MRYNVIMSNKEVWRAVITVTNKEIREAKATAALAGVDIQDWLADAVREKLRKEK